MKIKGTNSRSRWSMLWVTGVALVALALAACAPAATPTPAPTATAVIPVTTPTLAPTATTAPSTVTAEHTVSMATDPKLGPILVDEKGMTLYMFTKDTPDKSTCAGGCLKAWPALMTNGSPMAGTGVDASKLGSTDVPGGGKIVTYNHMPLYYWAKDTKPGDTTGQDVGNVWYVVNPNGTAVKPGAGATPTAAASSSSSEATLMVATDPKLGKILVDGKGMTLYMFTKDTADKSNCAGGCLKAWPALITQGSPVAGDGVDKTMLGSAAMPDGTKIVTYNHMPLYYYAKDTKAGDVTGQNVGNVWYVVDPTGKVVNP